MEINKQFVQYIEINNEGVDNYIKGHAAEKSKSKVISLNVPLQLLNKIDAKAKSLSISRASFIKQSCSVYLTSITSNLIWPHLKEMDAINQKVDPKLIGTHSLKAWGQRLKFNSASCGIRIMHIGVELG